MIPYAKQLAQHQTGSPQRGQPPLKNLGTLSEATYNKKRIYFKKTNWS